MMPYSISDIHDRHDALFNVFFGNKDFNHTMIEYADHLPWAHFAQSMHENNKRWRASYPDLDNELDDYIFKVGLHIRRRGHDDSEDEDEDED